jgi:hypothetical protein
VSALRLACEYGPSFNCTTGRHAACAHNPGSAQENGSWAPEGYLTRGAGGDVVMDDGAAVLLLPMHCWRCDCECHKTIKPVQLSLLEGVEW